MLFTEKFLEAYNTGVEAFRQHKSDGLTADRIDSTMLDMEQVRLNDLSTLCAISSD